MIVQIQVLMHRLKRVGDVVPGVMEGKNTQNGKKDAEVTNIDVQQPVPSTGPSKNDVQQCTPVCAEPPKSKMESCSTEQEHEVLLYSPPKRSLLLASKKSQGPIKVSCLMCTLDRKKSIVNDMTKVSFPDSLKYSFQFEDACLATPDLMTILQVLNKSDEWNLVTMKGKVMNVKDPIIVG